MSISLQQIGSYRHRLMAVGILVLSTVMSLTLLVMRWMSVGYLMYGCLVKDLFLAWVPMWISMWIYVLHKRGRRNRPLVWWGLAWLLFFPNAPYLLTEFVHLKPMHNGTWWCDLVVFIGFAWNGLMLGLMSLYCMQEVVRARLGARRAWLMAATVLVLGSFGISLGRFERFNSWDIIRHPFSLCFGIINQFTHPAAYPKSMAISVLLCGFLSLAYLALWTLVLLNEDNASRNAKWD
jgi:uncharacterized membrane protein